ncbi:unnamed protein product [Moneuplotes crassus]|uniref:Uncharacterized protein n=1 Tax=Euplotes crassus TaxID=5936 RepID=A0AAD1UJZ8_EUPCR|nr:unnamed protein product [Moneuplotes crassus]
MSKSQEQESNLESSKNPEELNAPQQSRCRRFSCWYWGSNTEEYINPDERATIGFTLLMTFRTILTTLLIINTIYRFIWTGHDGVNTFFRYQLYFTTWSLYVTLYTEIWIISTSLYNHKKGVDFENKKQLRILMHNHIFMILTLAMESVTTLMYWTAIYEYGKDISPKECSRILDHSLPLVVILFEFFSNGWVLYQRQTVTILILLVYFPVNILYTVFGPRPLYSRLPWNNIESFIFVVAVFGIAFGGHALYSLFSKWRFNRAKKRQQK